MNMDSLRLADMHVSEDFSISTIMTPYVWSASIDDTLADIKKILATRDVSSVPIMDSKGTIFGIVSSRDLLRCGAAKINLRAVQAWEICGDKPIEVGPDASVHEVVKLMLEKEIPHVLVVDNGFVKGFVSTVDFVQRLLERA
jgi:CBS domain-containing protein